MRFYLALATLMLAGCAATKPALGVKVDPSLATLIPSDSVFLAGTRLQDLEKAQIYQKHFAGRTAPQIDEFSRRIGIDPRKDLWELLYVSNGRDGVLLGRGKLADEGLEPGLKANGAQRFGYKGFKLIGGESAAVLFVNSTTAGLGPVSALHWIVDRRGTSRGAPPALAAMMREIPPEAQVWSVFTGGAAKLPVDPNSNFANVNQLLQSVQSGSIYFDLRDGVHGLAFALCTSDDSAQQVEGAIKAAIGIGRLSAPKDKPEFAQIYDGIRATQEGNRVKLYIDIPQNLADEFLSAWLK
ncbi:MAG: hypothetical protein ACRD30_04615 [Bryobacteraceae bacterium]